MNRAAVVAVMCIGAGLGGVASANTNTVTAEQLALSRICASEAGIGITPDCGAILSVLRSRSERTGRDLLPMMRAYASNAFRRDRTDHRRWIAHLDATGRRPEGWPAHASWERYAPAWRELLEHAGELLVSPSTCPASMHWGDRHGDRLRALRAGWSQVDCGNTRNLFWRIR